MEVQQLLRELVEAEKEEDEDMPVQREREGRQICMQDRMSASLPPFAGSAAGLTSVGLILIHLGRLS